MVLVSGWQWQCWPVCGARGIGIRLGRRESQRRPESSRGTRPTVHARVWQGHRCSEEPPRHANASWRAARPFLFAAVLLHPVCATQCLSFDVHIFDNHGFQQLTVNASASHTGIWEGGLPLPSPHSIPCFRASVGWAALGCWLGVGFLLALCAVQQIFTYKPLAGFYGPPSAREAKRRYVYFTCLKGCCRRQCVAARVGRC